MRSPAFPAGVHPGRVFHREGPLKSSRFLTISLLVLIFLLLAANIYQNHVIRTQSAELRWYVEHRKSFR